MADMEGDDMDTMDMPEDMDGDGDVSGDDDMDFKPPNELPDGVKKEILKEGEGWKKPKAGDDVTVHYVGTLEADGSEFDSSRGRDQPFVFPLGKGQVIQGWDLGVATMKKGELAKFTLSSEYAYGESGSPPKIPGGATLVFEVELLSWLSKDDLFQDGGVIKTEVKEGKGWKEPSVGDEVQISMKCTAKDGSVVEDKSAFVYLMGSDTLGPLSKTLDKALCSMKKDEEVELVCTKDYACGEKTPDGATVSLILEQIFESKDVSFAKDRSLIKKQVVEGDGYNTPIEASKVKLSVTETVAGSLPGFEAKTLEFIAGDGEVCDALEFAVLDMKQGEKAVLTCTKPAILCEEKLGLKEISAKKAVLTLELLEFEKGKQTWDMDEDEKIEFGTARKEVGSNHFRTGRIQMALGRYKKVIEVFNYTDNMKEPNKTKAKDLKKACELNSASCQLKLKEYKEAEKHCNNVLKEEAMSVKALYRRAQAHIGLKNFMDSMADLKKLIEVDPKNREARTLFKEAQAGQKEEDKKSKGLFANMCKALGKGPIPTPSQDKKIVDDDEGDMADEEMPSADAKTENAEGTEQRPAAPESA
mmetsp:Transcript_32937/g.61405  ORF Transcript_32937/g.61405 Transcript_32937/m.61405 type:complete len:586 (+) Transcript_32937:74-1831(+)